MSIAEGFLSLSIVASNDINENILLALNREGHEITTFGIGTVSVLKMHIHTCTHTYMHTCRHSNTHTHTHTDLLKVILTYLPQTTLFCIICFVFTLFHSSLIFAVFVDNITIKSYLSHLTFYLQLYLIFKLLF